MADLTRGLGPLHKFLQDKRTGDRFTADEVANAAGWKLSTFLTYVRKNKFASIFVADGDGKYRMLQDGARLRAGDVSAALTQKTERRAGVMKDDELDGNKGRYVLLRNLGEGAVGQVWEAQNAVGGSRVAVKLCSPRADLLEPSVFANVKERFRKEYKLGPKLRHPHLVEHLDYGEHGDFPFLVMELAEGTLDNLIGARGRLTASESVDVIAQLLEGLAHLHTQNCVHRDIKPANILRTRRGWVLGDFGIVRWGDLSKSFTGAGTITRSSVQLGSWHYMAPEQQEDAHAATAVSDMYALGITWIEMLTGDAPHPARVAAGRLGDPSDLVEVNRLLERMTAFDAPERPMVREVMPIVAELRRRLARTA